jgi:hypothetical protein
MSITGRIRVTCKDCGAVMTPEHGIINTDNGTGVTWWQCPCGRRIKERYEIQQNKIVTVEVIEI